MRGGEVFWSWLGSFLGIGLVAYINDGFLPNTDLVLIIGSFGASAVLSTAPSKPPGPAPPPHRRARHFRPDRGDRLADSVFRTLAGRGPGCVGQHRGHAPDQDPAPSRRRHRAIAVIGGPKIHQLGYFYAFMPVAAGALIMLAVALIVNNLAPTRRYPEYWF